MISSPQHDNIGALVPLEKDRDYAAEAQAQARLLSINDDLHKFFLTLFEKEKQNESEWLSIKKTWVKARNYFDNRQFGRVDDSCNWQEFSLRPGEQTFQANIFTPNIQTALMELTRSVTKLKFSHTSPESRIGQLVAVMAEQRYATHRKRTFTSLKVDQENLSLLLNGIAFRYTYWNRKTGRKSKVPMMGEQNVAGEGEITLCSYCASQMSPDGMCSYCGSDESRQISDSQLSVKSVVGYDDIECGESDWISPDPLGISFYLHATSLKDTPYLIWKQDIVTEVLQSQFPDIRIVDGSESRELEMKAELDARSPNDRFFADGESASKSTAEFVQGWFDPPLYANRIIKSDVRLRSGVVLKGGTRLGQYFPDGLYLAKNSKNILDVWNENKSERWTCAPYVTRPGTLVGAGSTVALTSQDTKNDLVNLEMRSAFNDAFNKEFVNVQYLEGQTIPDDPTERGIVTNLPEGMSIVGNVIDRLPGAPLSSDVYALDERQDALMQLQLGTFSGASSDPLPDAVQNTATGFLAWRNMTVGRYAPMLGTRADALDREQAYQLLENDQKYLTMAEWEKLKGDYDAEAVKMFRQCDVRRDIVIEILPESLVPKTQQDRRAEKAAFFELVMNAQIDPASEWGAFVGEDYNVPKNIVGLEVYRSMAYEQIYAFRAIAEDIVASLGDIPSFDIQTDMIAQEMGQMVVMQANKPINAKMEDLTVMADTYKDFWASDTGRASSNVLKAAILYRMSEMDGTMIRKAQEDQAMMMAAQAPAMEAQAQQQQAQQEQAAAQKQSQMDAEDEKEQRETEKEAIRIAIDDEKEQRRMAYDADRDDRRMEHELQLEQMRLSGREKAAKEKK